MVTSNLPLSQRLRQVEKEADCDREGREII